MNEMRPILIMAGGTGGHVYPALAVASELQSRGVHVVWMGTRAGIEARVVPQHGFDIRWIDVQGLRGKSVFSKLLAPLKLVIACLQALKILIEVKPSAVLGMGGFVAGPGGLMAWLLRIPLVIHEQNAVAGMTNRILSRFADHILVAFPHSLDVHEKVVGNPVRKEILQIVKPESGADSVDGPLRLLVVGGSLGAAKLNELIPEALSMIDSGRRPMVIHQSGEKNLGTTLRQYEGLNVKADVRPYIEDMAKAYAWADLVICRSGAMTVFEIAAVGVASVLIPYPYAVDDHQTANADYLAEKGAALLVQQEEVDANWLSKTIDQFISQRDHLLAMAKEARSCAKPHAAREVADLCLSAGGSI